MRVKMSKPPPPAPTASAIGPCPTVIQIVGRPGTGSLPSTIAPPDHPNKSVQITTHLVLNYDTVGIELTTSTTPPSTALSATSTNCAIETTPKKIVRIALI